MKATSILLTAALSLSASPALSAPTMLVDAASGDILYAQEATLSWHPASLTKLMTAHLALSAAKRGDISMNTPVVMSARAAAEPPSKLGLPVGHALRLEDALRVMLVRSTNDVAVAIAEAVAGSHESFVAAMNAEAARLGMSGTRFTNANGLHDDRQVTNARDMAVLAIAVIRAHEDRADLFRTPFVSVMGKRLKNTNDLLGKYPGVDGMKTGYVCASGFNLVASAQRDGRHFVSVVLGSPGTRQRGETTRGLLDLGFSGAAAPQGSLRTVRAAVPGEAVDLRPYRCGKAASAAVRATRLPVASKAAGRTAPAPKAEVVAGKAPDALPPPSPVRHPLPPKGPARRF